MPNSFLAAVMDMAEDGDPRAIATQRLLKENAAPTVAGMGAFALTGNPMLSTALASGMKTQRLSASLQRSLVLELAAKERFKEFEQMRQELKNTKPGEKRNLAIREAGQRAARAYELLAQSYETSSFTPRDVELGQAARAEQRNIQERVTDMLVGKDFPTEATNRVRQTRTRARATR